METHFENGYRVTDQTVLETAEMALSARVNKSIVAALDRIGAKACGISGRDGGLITARQKDKALGLVGDHHQGGPPGFCVPCWRGLPPGGLPR